jgi:hypothetical protein
MLKVLEERGRVNQKEQLEQRASPPVATLVE